MNREAQINSDESHKVRQLSAIMDMGEILLTSGAEVSRVEDTISRLCRAYGFERSDVLTITSSIIVTAVIPGGDTITQTRRIKARDTRLDKVEMINGLSRRVCMQPLALSDLTEEISEIEKTPGRSDFVQCVMYMLISFAFALFFGGTWWDGIAAAASGAILFASINACATLRLNDTIVTMLCSTATAMTVILLVRAGIGVQPDKIMIGNIMLVIPGRQITNSLRDMISSDTISGLLNMVEALQKAVFIAIGFALAMLLM